MSHTPSQQSHDSFRSPGTQPSVHLEEPESSDDSAVPIGDLLASDLSPTQPSASDILLSADPASAALGEKILGPELEMSDEPEFDSILRSRVLKDPFHVFNMFYISATHPLRLQFTRELRDAIFIPDQADKSRINSWGELQNPPQTYNTLRNSSPQWIRERCKHIIPAPKKLWLLVSRIFRTYGPLIDPKTKKPLFTTDNWKTAKHVLDLIQNGFLSDPPGIPLYTVVGLDTKAGVLPFIGVPVGPMRRKEEFTNISEHVCLNVVLPFVMLMLHCTILFYIITFRYVKILISLFIVSFLHKFCYDRSERKTRQVNPIKDTPLSGSLTIFKPAAQPSVMCSSM